jgi:predicted TIM-barrel fold metal-dependent hydrolase
MWHQGTTFPSKARLKWSLPLQLEDVAMDFPDLKMIIAHLGHPWEEDCVVLVRKCPNLYTDISAVHYRPWRYWQGMMTAMEYGVTHKILLASDFPSGTITNVINGLRAVNKPVEGTGLPQIPKEIQDMIIYENWKSFFPHWAN